MTLPQIPAEVKARLLIAPESQRDYWEARLRWRAKRHPHQVPPSGYWWAWLLRGGRGSGKTRPAAEDLVDWLWDHPRHRYGVVAPTLEDVRSICFEGESGVLEQCRARGLRDDVDFNWNRGPCEFTMFHNGSHAKGYSSERPNRLRGPQFHRLWIDEAAALRDADMGDQLNTTFNNASLTLRLGDDPRMIITTTPRANKLMKELDARPDVAVTTGSTHVNAANLAPTFKRTVMRYQGTRIGRQEIEGELLEDVEGAPWRLTWIDSNRLREPPEQLRRVVIGVDPPGGLTECGIVAVGEVPIGECLCGYPDWPTGKAMDRDLIHYVVVADDSLQGTPRTWGRQVAQTFDDQEADLIVAERNYGGDMVTSNLKTQAEDMGVLLPVKMVNATRGKLIRAEPVVNLYEQKRVHHIGVLAELEDEQTTWVPPGNPDPSNWSPNRMDGLVWAISYMAGKKKRRYGAR